MKFQNKIAKKIPFASNIAFSFFVWKELGPKNIPLIPFVFFSLNLYFYLSLLKERNFQENLGVQL